MFKIYVVPVMSAIKPGDWKTNQNSDVYMISGIDRHQIKKVIGLEWKKQRISIYAGDFEGSADRKKIWNHQMFICTISSFLFYVKAKRWYRSAAGRMG